jgi:hypothetical protein
MVPTSGGLGLRPGPPLWGEQVPHINLHLHCDRVEVRKMRPFAHRYASPLVVDEKKP